MRASRYTIFAYASMIGVPVLMLILAAATVAGKAAYSGAASILLAIALIVFGVSGVVEIFWHGAYPGSQRKIIAGEDIRTRARPVKKYGKEISFVLLRFNSLTKRFDRHTYTTYANDRTTVLGAILDIKDYQDSTISVRCNCRMGICGSCGMVVNGKPVLACETNVLASAKYDTIEVSPMLGHPLLKDMVTDFDDFFERHRSVDPSLYRKDQKEKYTAREEYAQSKAELSKFLPYSYCIMCGLCLDACPVVNSNPNFIGPQALSQVYRYHADSRDQKGKRRLFEADTMDGVWGCEFSGSCSKACPKGVDPASAIQMLKGELMKDIADKNEKVFGNE